MQNLNGGQSEPGVHFVNANTRKETKYKMNPIEKAQQIIPISEAGELVYTHWDQLTMISRQIMDAGITKLGNPAQINLIILKGKRLGLDIFEALENISVIGNRTSINGALASALVERSGLMVDKSHTYKGEGESRECAVTVQRKGRSKVTWSFSIKEAKQAGLYPGRPGSGWNSYPDSMMYWRALGFCFRREFSDVLQGMYLTEELTDEVREVKIVTDAPPVSVTSTPVASAPPEAAPQAKEAKEVPFVPDPEDPKAHEHPIITAPSMVNGLVELRALAAGAGISDELLIEVVNGLRLFPRGVEFKLENLPQAKIQTLIKNWSTVEGQATRIREKKNE